MIIQIFSIILQEPSPKLEIYNAYIRGMFLYLFFLVYSMVYILLFLKPYDLIWEFGLILQDM